MLVKNVIARAPGDIKAILNEEAYRLKSCFEFMKRYESTTWIAYPERIVQRVESNGPREVMVERNRSKEGRRQEPYCLYTEAEIITRENAEI